MTVFHLARFLGLIIALGVTLCASDPPPSGPASYETWCLNHSGPCQFCCTGSGPTNDHAGQDCDHTAVSSSQVLSCPLTYIHGVWDWQVSEASAGGGCAPCGGGPAASGVGQLPSLAIERVMRTRFGMAHTSFGPTTSMGSYDMHLDVSASSMRIYDPTRTAEWIFASDSNADFAVDG